MIRVLAPLLVLLLLGCSSPVVPATTPAVTPTTRPALTTVSTAPLQSGYGEPVRDAEAVARWHEDLTMLAERLPVIHPNPFHTVAEAEFKAAVRDVEAQLPYLSDDRIIVEFMRIVALLGEGHSFLSAVQPATGFELYPLRLYEFRDGIFVVDAQPPYEGAIGAKLLGVGGVELAEAYERLASTIGRDSEVGLKTLVPVRLINASVLHALGIIEDPSAPRFRLQTRDGRLLMLDPLPIPAEDYADWAYPADLGDLARFLAYEEVVLLGGLPQRPGPLHLRARYAENFWSSFLEESEMLYVQYNLTVGSSPGAGSLQNFSEAIAKQLDAHDGVRLVVDMRHNPGGENGSYPPLLDLLTTHPTLTPPGRLFIITGRHTGSAAVNLLSDLEQRGSEAILVGEATTSRPNMYGDPRLLRLPHSGLEVYISSRYWEKSEPGDTRDRIEPDVPISLSSEDYFSGQDPVLDWILQQPVPPDLARGIDPP